jgi:hypothetical protein
MLLLDQTVGHLSDLDDHPPGHYRSIPELEAATSSKPDYPQSTLSACVGNIIVKAIKVASYSMQLAVPEMFAEGGAGNESQTSRREQAISREPPGGFFVYL